MTKRVGQQGSGCRIWAVKGVRPRKVKQKQFLSTYIYGAANHKTGESFALILPYANTAAMNKYLHEFSSIIKSGSRVNASQMTKFQGVQGLFVLA